jgi:uncharacterized membrane protein YeaQ/YmgE (transglycosylase-associated protein family)
MHLDPAAALLAVIVIGVAVGLVFDRFAGPGWLSRQVAGVRRSILTSALVGIAGAFIGWHLALLLARGSGQVVALVAAVVGAAAVLWIWRTLR